MGLLGLRLVCYWYLCLNACDVRFEVVTWTFYVVVVLVNCLSMLLIG